jgi:hypothetical protein
MVNKTQAPDRIKRLVKTTTTFTVVQAVLGIMLFLNILSSFWIIDLMHVFISFAIITQASSAATGYDMWEEKEFIVPQEETDIPKSPEVNPTT